MYADNTKNFRVNRDRFTTGILQNDLDLGHCSSNWLLKFQSSKFKVITYGKPKEPFHRDYCVEGGLDALKLDKEKMRST